MRKRTLTDIANNDRKNHRVFDSQPLRGDPVGLRGDRLGRVLRHPHAGRRHPRSVREPGDRVHRLDGPQPARNRGPDHLSALGEPARAGGREGRSGQQRVQLLDDRHHLRGQRRFLLRAPARAGAARPGQHVPAAGRDSLPGPRRHGPGANLLVHRRGRGLRPRPAQGHPGLVRPLPAQFRARRGAGRLGGRLSDRVPDRRRPQQTPRRTASRWAICTPRWPARTPRSAAA